jgi:hypothetical protein
MQRGAKMAVLGVMASLASACVTWKSTATVATDLRVRVAEPSACVQQCEAIGTGPSASAELAACLARCPGATTKPGVCTAEEASAPSICATVTQTWTGQVDWTCSELRRRGDTRVLACRNNEPESGSQGNELVGRFLLGMLLGGLR